LKGLSLEPVVPSDMQAKALYDLLKTRQHPISHVSLPSYEEHAAFVFNNPYRCWYLICREGEVLGSLYLLFDNSVGIDVRDEVDREDLRLVIDLLRKSVQPMPPIASLRYKDFFFNVSPSNKKLQRCLEEIGYVPAQTSYVLSE